MSIQTTAKPTPTTTLSIRISEDLDNELSELAKLTERSKSFLAAKAIEAYVAHELKICRMLQEGLDDIKAGRVVSHEEVMAGLDEIIAKHK